MKRRLSGKDFELAWRFLPHPPSPKHADVLKSMAKMVLVDGKPIAKVADRPNWESDDPFTSGASSWVGKERLKSLVDDIYSQLFVSVG